MQPAIYAIPRQFTGQGVSNRSRTAAGGAQTDAAASATDCSTVAMVFYLVGLGLGDERDITVRGLEAVKKCDQVWLEAYTSVLCVGVERLEAFYGREVKVASREAVSYTHLTLPTKA